MAEGGLIVSLRAAEEAIRTLTLYTGVLDDPIGWAYRNLIDTLMPYPNAQDAMKDVGMPAEPSPASIPPHPTLGLPALLYRQLFALLAQEAEFAAQIGGEDAWRNHLLRRVLDDENPFTRKADQTGGNRIGPAVRDAVKQELRGLRSLFEFAGPQLREAVQRRDPDARHLPDLGGFEPLGEATDTPQAASERAMMEQFRAEERWETLLDPLAEYIGKTGLGIFRRYVAFRWAHHGGGGALAGIEKPDPIHLDDIYAYEGERELLIRNTEQFVAGYPANNVLLYGDRGTGKSSTVKALLHAYADRGLRMVEVQKEHLGDFPQIIRLLRGRRERFVLFIDDLSFEEHETHYKDLKALLEGSLEARPDNMVLYATSNRRHLVKERFSDRIHALEDDEIHLNDTTEEKLSLSDRFGLTLTFLSPTQERYLAIIKRMGEHRGVTLPEEELRTRALAWATQRGGRSGRVARQFMDHLVGEFSLADRESKG